MSWPTPDSAQGEERKKAQERAEKGEKEKPPAAKPHGRDKWMPVPYVPTAVFNTPLPSARRGGRASRGGRDGVNRGASANHNGTNGAERPSAGPPDSSIFPITANHSERGRAEPSSITNNSSSSKPKRASSAGPSTFREQWKNADSTGTDRPKEASVGPSKTNSNSGPSVSEYRRTSTATQTDNTKARRFSSAIASQQTGDAGHLAAKASPNVAERVDRYQNTHHENQTNTRTTGPDRRNEGSSRISDNARDFHGHVSNRERGEGRGERGRGNYRARANNGYPNSGQTNGQIFSHGQLSQNQASTLHQVSKSQTNHERHASQSQAAFYNSSHSTPRNFRTGSRTQTLPHSATYSRFPNGSNAPLPGAPPLSAIQTDIANSYGYQSAQQGVMSAVPYSVYMEPYSLFSMVTTQM